MADTTISINDLAAAIQKELDDYGKAVITSSEEALDAGAKVIQDALKEASPRRRPVFYKTWRVQKYKSERFIGATATVSGRSGEIPLTNILEFSTKHGHPFIQTTYERAIPAATQAYMNTLKKGI